ncbi:ribonuclease H-like domain-containing protein [Amylocystis lapponica]|nr:ribonuclease H-like domain-containing protein [Amylocystis lapponica]
MEGFAGNDASHTAEWIAKLLLRIINAIGCSRFSGVSSDSTGNTKACRRLLCAKIPTIINFPDPVHHTALAVKDICQLEFFEPVINNLRRTLTFFSHSDQSTSDLKKTRDPMGITRGLERIGVTRFATVIHSAVALRRCLPALREATIKGSIDIEVSSETGHLFTPYTQAGIQFELQLNQLIEVGLPYAKTILCFESTHSNAGDIYLFWCAIAASTNRILLDKNSALPSTVKGQIRGIFNSRWSQLFEEGPTDAHISVLYLNPGLSLSYSCGQAKATIFVPPDREFLGQIGAHIWIQRVWKPLNPMSSEFFDDVWGPPNS